MADSRSPKRPKQIAQQSIIGQQGIALIEARALEMGHLWYPTGGVEAGIDGHIEIRDPESGEVHNAIVRVQSKATKDPLGAPGDLKFGYMCDERDLNYWMEGNAPVILVRSRPDTKEAYWVSIKDYFRDPAVRKSRKVIFDKQRDQFDKTAHARLRDLAIPPERGVYFGSDRREERLISNLLPISHIAERLFLAETQFRSPKDLRTTLKAEVERPAEEWFIHNKRLYSFHDLSEYPWTKVCDRGTVESFETSEWALSDDEDRQRQLVRLLNQCLRPKLAQHRVWFHNGQECFFFRASENLKPRKITYRSATKFSKKTVFMAYPSKKDPGVVAYYRHTAFEGQFRRYDEQWFLEIVPTYLFTSDGHALHPTYESKLKGIKAQERNNAVRSHVLMWAYLLGERDSDLFASMSYSMLRFGRLFSFEVERGLNDSEWRKQEEPDDDVSLDSDEETFELFDDED